jgi:predicted Zn-dependent protease
MYISKLCHRPLKLYRSMQACLLLFAALSAFAANSAQNTEIPELGEPSSRAISPGQEREIGSQFYRQARSQNGFITDPLVNHYIQSLGDRLVNRNTLGNDTFTFFMFDNSAINAFAVPGGYIGFFSGLIEAAQNESQLVSVVAHEIAHVTQHHLARIYASQEGISLATTAAIIAGIIAGGQVGNASIYAGLAASQQSQINFTRQHELEADRIGIQLMANAQYDTHSMPAMFEVLHNASLQGDNERYEFLRTHPVSSQRIAEARSRAGENDNAGAVVDSLGFRLVKIRLEVLTTDNLRLLKRKFEQQNAEIQTPQNAYALAFIHQLLNAPERAERYIEQLTDMAPQSIYVQLLRASNLADLGQLDRALAVYAELHNNYPFHYPILEAYARALTRKGRHKKAKTTLRYYLLNASIPQPEAHRLLAFHLKQLGEMAESRINLADYFAKTDEPEAAFSQLRLALKEPRVSEEDTQRINAKLENIKQIRLQRK